MSWPSPNPDRQHGTYYPGQGWYDASRNAYLDSAVKLTPTSGTQPRQQPLRDVEYRTDTSTTADLVDKAHADTWRPDSRLEQLRRLRDTEPDLYRKMPAVDKMALGSYEEGIRAHLARGEQLPAGVRPLPKDAA